MKETIKSALAQLVGNKLRTFLTMLGMFIGIASVIMILSVGEGVKGYFNDIFSTMGKGTIMVQVYSDEASDLVTKEDLELISQMPEIKLVGNMFNEYWGTVKDYENTTRDAIISGIPYNSQEFQSFTISDGRMFSQRDEEVKSEVAIVLDNFSRIAYNRSDPSYCIGKKIDVTLWGEVHSFEIIGIMESMYPSSMPVDQMPVEIYLPFETMDDIVGNGDGRSDTAVVVVKDEYDVGDFTSAIRRILEKRHAVEGIYSCMSLSEQVDQINTILNTLSLFVSLVAAISLLVGGIGIMNIMMVTVKERTREIGIRKALGATDPQILSQFLIEAIILTVLGGLTGMTIGYIGGIFLANKLGIATQLTAAMVIFSVGTSSLIGIIFGVYPAYKAAKLDPVEALREE